MFAKQSLPVSPMFPAYCVAAPVDGALRSYAILLPSQFSDGIKAVAENFLRMMNLATVLV